MMGVMNEKGVLKTYLSKKYERLIDSLLVPEPEENSNRELIHNITSSLINASIEKYKRDRNNRNRADSMESDALSDSFWSDENFKQEYELDTPPVATSELEKRTAKKMEVQVNDQFLDIFVDKLIGRIVPERLPEREQFTERPASFDERKKPISATTLGKNMGKLGSKMSLIFDLQDSVIRLATWRNPSGTIALLILHTSICYYPILLLLIPIFYVMYGIMVQGYTHRHPIYRTVYPAKIVYGKSMIKDLFSGGPSNAWRPTLVTLPENNLDISVTDSSLPDLKSQAMSSGMEVVTNLRDFQNITSSLVEVNDSMNKFVYGTAGFKDERISTNLFFSCLITTTILAALSPYIAWDFLFSSSLWILLLSLHPKLRPILFTLLDYFNKGESKQPPKVSEKFDVILDEAPEAKTVEIFEIYEQGLTHRQWNFYKYSVHVFDESDHYRKLKQPPPGVQKLEEIEPPRTWKFDENSTWLIDFNPEKWAADRNLKLEAKNEYLIDDKFKRRRLTRRVLRYAKPANKPPQH